MDISAVHLSFDVALPRSLRRNLFFRPRPNPNILLTTPRRRGAVVPACVGSNNSSSGIGRTPVSQFDANAASVTYSSDAKESDDQLAEDPLIESIDGSSTQQKNRAAKIHDFCFGIPFGGFIFGGGLVGFLFSRNIAVLGMGALFGGAILSLSTCSLKVWRQGKSSIPYIFGQAALAAVLALKNFQTYSLTKKLFPSGFSAVCSAAMLCFYSYVMLSGGNPPPKKLKAAATSAAES